MSKKSNIVLLRRGFKVWPRGKRFNVSFKFPLSFFPKDLLGTGFSSFSAHIYRPIRLRRVLVRSLSYGYVSGNSIEAFRKVIAPYFRKSAGKHKFFLRCYSYMALTKKPSEVRMGGGKGSKIRGHFSPVRPGQVLFEVYAREPYSTKRLFQTAALKLGVRTVTEIV